MPETSTPERVTPSPGPGPALNYAPARRGPFRRAFGSTRRWVKDTFSKEQLLSGIKQLAWVAPLTLLIWVYAEREQQTTATMRFAVAARSSNPNVFVSVNEPSDGVIQAMLEGSRNRLDEVTGQVGAENPVYVDVPPDLRAGVHAFPVSAILNRDARFKGLTWTSGPNSTPVRVEVLVDPIVEQTLTVQVRPEDQERLSRHAFTPAKVKVRMPGNVARQARVERGGELVAYADLGAFTEKAPGLELSLPSVRVYVPGAESEHVKIEPATVSATLTLVEANQTYTIREVPVSLTGAGGVFEEYRVESNPATLFNVKVVGPRRAIEELAENEGADVRAHAWVSLEDVGAGVKKKVHFVLPDPALRVHPDSAEQEVDVTMTLRRQTAE